MENLLMGFIRKLKIKQLICENTWNIKLITNYLFIEFSTKTHKQNVLQHVLRFVYRTYGPEKTTYAGSEEYQVKNGLSILQVQNFVFSFWNTYWL